MRSIVTHVFDVPSIKRKNHFPVLSFIQTDKNEVSEVNRSGLIEFIGIDIGVSGSD
jgi:hypothetical protein